MVESFELVHVREFGTTSKARDLSRQKTLALTVHERIDFQCDK